MMKFPDHFIKTILVLSTPPPGLYQFCGEVVQLAIEHSTPNLRGKQCMEQMSHMLCSFVISCHFGYNILCIFKTDKVKTFSYAPRV